MTRNCGRTVGFFLSLLAGVAVSAAGAGQSPAAATCPVTAGDLPVWRPADGAAHGTQEFDRTTRLALPDGVTSIVVELWGGGGGGGGGAAASNTEGGAGGGGGASGAYARQIVSVHADPLVIVIGKGGGGGSPNGYPHEAGDGTASMACAGGRTLVLAAGGVAGRSAAMDGKGGIGGAAAVASPAQGVQRAGIAGSVGLAPLFEYRGGGGRGGPAVSGSVRPTGAFGGDGGAGEMIPDPPRPGASGGPGSAIVTW